MLAHIEYINQDNRVAGFDMAADAIDLIVPELEARGMRDINYWLIAA